jgi:hypothetical protein
VPEDDLSRLVDVLVQPQAGFGLAQKALERPLALLDWGPSQIGAVELTSARIVMLAALYGCPQ